MLTLGISSSISSLLNSSLSSSDIPNSSSWWSNWFCISVAIFSLPRVLKKILGWPLYIHPISPCRRFHITVPSIMTLFFRSKSKILFLIVQDSILLCICTRQLNPLYFNFSPLKKSKQQKNFSVSAPLVGRLRADVIGRGLCCEHLLDGINLIDSPCCSVVNIDLSAAYGLLTLPYFEIEAFSFHLVIFLLSITIASITVIVPITVTSRRRFLIIIIITGWTTCVWCRWFLWARFLFVLVLLFALALPVVLGTLVNQLNWHRTLISFTDAYVRVFALPWLQPRHLSITISTRWWYTRPIGRFYFECIT